MNDAQLLRDREPIRLFKTPRSLSEYILMKLQTPSDLSRIELNWIFAGVNKLSLVTQLNSEKLPGSPSEFVIVFLRVIPSYHRKK